MTSSKHVAKHRPKHKPTEKRVEPELKISFQSQEFPHHNKNELWYIGIGLLLLVGLFASISVKNYLFALVVVAGGLAIFRVAHLTPGSREVAITPRGVTWGESFYPYHKLKCFWASEANGQVTTYIEQPNFAPVLHFAIPDDKVEITLTALSFELPFHEHKNEPVSDRLARLLRI